MFNLLFQNTCITCMNELQGTPREIEKKLLITSFWREYLKFLKFLKFLLKVRIHVSLIYNRYLTPRADTLSPRQKWVRVDFVSNGTENDEDTNGGTRTTVGPNRVLK